jgi:hypothetical protein
MVGSRCLREIDYAAQYEGSSHNRKQSLTRLAAHPATHENVLSYDFRVSASVSESKFGRIDSDTDSDPERVLFEEAAP